MEVTLENEIGGSKTWIWLNVKLNYFMLFPEYLEFTNGIKIQRSLFPPFDWKPELF